MVRQNFVTNRLFQKSGEVWSIGVTFFQLHYLRLNVIRWPWCLFMADTYLSD